MSSFSTINVCRKYLISKCLFCIFQQRKKNTLQRELILNFMRCTILQSFYHKVNLQWSDYDIPYGASRDMKYKRKKKAFQRFRPQKNQVSKDHIPSLLALKDNLWTKMYTFSFFSGMYAIFAFRNTSVC